MTGKGKFPNETCSERIAWDFWGHTKACQQPVTTHEDGKAWCTIHAPSYVAKRRIEREAKWDARAAADRKRWQEESRNKDRLALYPELVKALNKAASEIDYLITVPITAYEVQRGRQLIRDLRAVLDKAAAIEKGNNAKDEIKE